MQNINNNSWNRLRYTLYTPVYDLVGRYFAPYRQASIEGLKLQPGERVVLLGAGTGLDLPYLPKEADILATDLTPSMVSAMEARAKELGLLHFKAEVMDGQDLALPDDDADAVVLHLILAVIPDPIACIKEAERILRPGGRLCIMDKFLPQGHRPSLLRRATNLLTNTLFSDINRDARQILSHTRLRVLSDTPIALGGNFRIIQCQKPA